MGGEVGYRFARLATRPRLALAFEAASGDDDTADGVVGTFDQLFRQEKDFPGFLVLYGRQNLVSVSANLTAALVPRKVMLQVFFYGFWLESRRDAIYNPGGFPVRHRAEPTGKASAALGRELDLALGWRIDRHHEVLLGFLRYWNGAFLNAMGGGDTPAGIFLQYKLLF